MNNNVNFNPQTGQPIQNTPVQQTITPTPELNNVNQSQEVQIQNQLQNVPTVDQDKQAFINNVQTISQEKKEEKKEGVNFAFIIILFVIILISIYFLFPLLAKYI